MAATETARSSSGSADSYIGSFISLTSKSEIRYEGVLFNINTEESSIGLRNVRSYGTEGRKKDGPQVPPSDKIYEYILFRGSDIKDLQVKSSPPVQAATPPIPNDPAIIQSHYPHSAVASTSLSSGTGSIPDPGPNTSAPGLLRPTFQGSLPQYQPPKGLGPLSSTPAPNTNGLTMPMYWQGYYGTANGLPSQQQTLLRPPPGLSMPPFMQQPLQYPAMTLSFPTAPSNLPPSQLSENIPSLSPPFSSVALNPQSEAESSTIVSESSTNLIPDKVPVLILPTAVPNTSLPLVSPSTNLLDKGAVVPLVSDKPKTAPVPLMPLKGMSEPSPSTAGTSSSVLSDGTIPSLVTPGYLLQPGVLKGSSSLPLQTTQKDVEVVHVTSPELAPAPAPILTLAQAAAQPQPPITEEAQEPVLPSPSPPDYKLHEASLHNHHSYRGHGRGRGHPISRSATRYTEDFDFTAMNEKFNKDEVWGHLGKSSVAQNQDRLQNEHAIGSANQETNPVYVKDDFFDSLSCDSLHGGSRNGRARFSEQMRRDTETFGDFPRHRGGRGGRGPFQGSRGRSSYYGRGYGYVGRGRGYGMASRAI